MPHTVTHDAGSGIVELTFHGTITADDLRESTAGCIALQKQTGARRFLVRASGGDVSASYFDIVALPEEEYVDEGMDPLSRIAVILPASPEAAKAAQFYRTACANRGWNVQLFAERQSAIDWLTRH